jgi:hypothetical protein
MPQGIVVFAAHVARGCSIQIRETGERSEKRLLWADQLQWFISGVKLWQLPKSVPTAAVMDGLNSTIKSFKLTVDKKPENCHFPGDAETQRQVTRKK